jgi:hypothetical protein
MDVRASMARDVQCKHVSNLHVILHNRHRQLGSHRIMDSLDRDGDGEAVLALPLPFYIYIVKSVLVVFFSLFCFPRGHNWDIIPASHQNIIGGH